MRNTAAKGRKLLFLVAGLALAGLFLATVPAEASRPTNPPFIAALEAPRVTLETLETATASNQIQPENRFRLFEDLGWPMHPLELLQVKKTASGVFDLGIECNVWQIGDLSQKCSSPSFQGLWTDPLTGIAYARNRWYDARTAHWLSEDPAGAFDSPNLYAFVAWAPNMYSDPTGESATVGGAIGGFLWGFGQMAYALGRDTWRMDPHNVGYYFSIWGQNTIGGLELGASIDVGLMSFGLALPTSSALGSAGFDALTFRAEPEEWGQFGKNQAVSGATGFVLGPALGWAGRGLGAGGRWAYQATGANRLGAAIGSQVRPAARAFASRLPSPSASMGAGPAGGLRNRAMGALARFESGALRETGRLGGLARWHNRMQLRYTYGQPPGGHWTQGVRYRLGQRFGIRRPEEVHHWFFPDRTKLVPNYIRNARWNLMRMPDRAGHAMVDVAFTSAAARPFPLAVRPWVGMADWARGAVVGHFTQQVRSQE